jgi:HlyD family secretion protein
MFNTHFNEAKDIGLRVSQSSSLSPTQNDAKAGSKYRTRITWLISSGILAVAGVGGWLSYQSVFNLSAKPVAVSIIPVSLGNVETTVTESGTVELGGQQTFKSPQEVTIEQVHVKEGDRVRQGQPLVVLRDRAVGDQINDQLAENAKFELDLTRNQKRVAEVRQKLAEARVDPDLIRSRERIGEVREKLKDAEARFKESQELLNRGFISVTDLQTDKNSLDTARAELRDARANQLKAEQNYKTKLDTIQAEIQDALVNQQKAEVDVQKGVEKLKSLQQQFADRIVIAPMDGLVLKVNVRKGDGAKIESNLLTIGDPTKEVVNLQLSTLNATKVRINQVAKVSMIGPTPKIFTGRVISLSPQATVSAASSETFEPTGNGQAKVDARVLLDRPSNTLIPGSTVSVEIVTAARQNVVAIPPEAIQRSETTPFVWLKDSQGKSKKQPIQLGLQGLQAVEVTSGLKVGEQLVIPPPDKSLTPGTPLNNSSESEFSSTTPQP